MIGKTISHYRIIEKLGEGGMGVVYKAEDAKLERTVAIKFLPKHIASQVAERERFKIEAKAAAALNHPNIATIHAIEEIDEEMFIVMECVEGQELKKKVMSDQLSVICVIDIATQIAEGLRAAHAKGIIHRDIKSSNIMVTESGQVKIMDFGLAKFVEASDRTSLLPKSGTTLGTAAYMSPEQTWGEQVDHRTDIWSFGVVLYEMLTGQLPFRGEYEQAVIYSILIEEPDPVTKHRSDISPGLAEVVQKALQKNREDRYPSATDILRDLQRLKQVSSNFSHQFPEREQTTKVSQRDPKAEFRAASKQKSKRIALFSSFGIIAAILAIALHFMFFSESEPETDRLPMRTVRLTSFSGQEYNPALSPDGKSIAFSWNGPQQDNFDIYAKLIDAGTPIRLTTNPLGEYRPAWSPDGRYIAYIRATGTLRDELYIIPALVGGTERKIAEYGGTQQSSMCWSSDGKFIFISDDWEDKGSRIFKVPVLTSDKRQDTTLPPENFSDHTPRVSPDGKMLAFVRESPSALGDVYLISFGDMEATRLTFDDLPIEGLSWTPNSRSVVFNSNRDGAPGLWRVSTSGGKPEKITVGGVSMSDPSISFAGNRLAYQEIFVNDNIWKISLANPEKKAPLITSTQRNVFPDISPDGMKIVLSSNRTGSYEVWVCESDGTTQTQLTTLNSPNQQWARWSPNGEHIVFSSETVGSGETAIYIIPVAGGKPQKRAEKAFWPSWSRNGEWIYFTTYEGQIHKMAAASSESKPLTTQGGITPSESWDGEYVYYTKWFNRPEIWRIPVAGGEELPLIEDISSVGAYANWAQLKGGIYYIKENTGSQPVLEFFDFATKRTERLATLQNAVFNNGITLSPDGTWLLYPVREQAQSDIMLIENFR
jgi:serine/threonine protein kinase